MHFRQVTIVGTGLIGGSLGLALKHHHLAETIVGCDRAEILLRAQAMGAIDRAEPEPAAAAIGSEVVVLATPVGSILDLIERLGPGDPVPLITDVGSTKAWIVERAAKVFGPDWPRRFLPGHPMAGKAEGGIEHAEAELFHDAAWIFDESAAHGAAESAAQSFIAGVQLLGAHPVFLSAERQDRICAWVSHLQQFTATALAVSLREMEAELGPEAQAIGGRALREMTRIAASPYSMWRDIALTNEENIQAALGRLEQNLAHLRENLNGPELREQFRLANEFRERFGKG